MPGGRHNNISETGKKLIMRIPGIGLWHCKWGVAFMGFLMVSQAFMFNLALPPTCVALLWLEVPKPAPELTSINCLEIIILYSDKKGSSFKTLISPLTEHILRPLPPILLSTINLFFIVRWSYCSNKHCSKYRNFLYNKSLRVHVICINNIDSIAHIIANKIPRQAFRTCFLPLWPVLVVHSSELHSITHADVCMNMLHCNIAQCKLQNDRHEHAKD